MTKQTFPLPWHRRLLAALLTPVGLADYYVGVRGRRRARRQIAAGQRGIVVAVRMLRSGRGPSPELGWRLFDVQVTTADGVHDLRFDRADRKWIDIGPGPVTVRAYSLLAEDPELRATFELTEDEPVVLVEIRPRMRDRIVSSSPPSIEVFGAHGRTLAHESGRRERAVRWE